MSLPVSLSAVVDELDSVSSDINAYINKATGELFSVSNEELVMIETGYDAEDVGAWQLELLAMAEMALNSSDVIQLPTSFDIHEWSIMEAFCATVESDRQRRNLLDQIHGKGAFRKFKDTLARYSLLDEWYAFRQAALTRIAKEFLEEAGIPFVP